MTWHDAVLVLNATIFLMGVHVVISYVVWPLSPFPPALPTPVTTLTILETTQNYLEFVFLASNSKDMPLYYVVEIRREGTEDWKELRLLSGNEFGNITVNLQYDFQVSATYYVKVFPIFVYNGVHYRGHGAQATFIAQTPPAIVQTPPVTGLFLSPCKDHHSVSGNILFLKSVKADIHERLM